MKHVLTHAELEQQAHMVNEAVDHLSLPTQIAVMSVALLSQLRAACLLTHAEIFPDELRRLDRALEEAIACALPALERARMAAIPVPASAMN